MKTKTFALGIVVLFIVSSLSILVTISQEPVLSQEAPVLRSHASVYYSGVERTWDAGSAGDASLPANWDPVGVPDTGDNITFDGTSVFNCTWNVEVTLGDFGILDGYTGVVTISVNIGGNGNTVINNGTFAGSALYYWTQNGNFTVDTAATMSGGWFNLIMTQDDTTAVVGKGISVDCTIKSLDVRANITLTPVDGHSLGVRFNYAGSSSLIIAEGKTLTLSHGLYFYTASVSSVWDNQGLIQATAGHNVNIRMFSYDFTFDFGDIDADVTFLSLASVTGSYTIYLDSDTLFQKDLYVYSGHATNTVGLNCNGYDLTVGEILTLGTRGIIDARNSTITVGEYIQSGTGSVFTQNGTFIDAGDFTVSAGVFNALGDMTVKSPASMKVPF